MSPVAVPAPHTAVGAVSPWIRRWGRLVPAGADVLDVACGGGRHSLWFATRGCRVLAVDRDPSVAALASLSSSVDPVVADLETGTWPFAGRRFAAVVVTNYLHRPLFPHLLDAVAPGGVLIYETFALGNERYGRPANPDFLLQPGELLDVVDTHLRVVAIEDRRVDRPKPALVQRICAVRGSVSGW